MKHTNAIILIHLILIKNFINFFIFGMIEIIDDNIEWEDLYVEPNEPDKITQLKFKTVYCDFDDEISMKIYKVFTDVRYIREITDLNILVLTKKSKSVCN